MKKAWVFLFALVLLIASVPLFAEGAAPKWTNWSEGIVYPFYQVGTAPATNGVGPSWIGAGAYQGWYFNYDGNNYGYATVFEFGDATFAGVSFYSVYFKMFDMIKVTLGKPNVRDYRITDKINGNGWNALFNWGDAHGLAIQATPVAGLSLGLGLYVPNTTASANAVALDFAKNFGLGASYAIPDVATIAVDYRADKSQFAIGANITAIKDIGITASYQADFANSAQLKHNAFVSASAAFAPITVAFSGVVKLAATMNYAAEVDLQYAMAPFALGITAGYDNGAGWVGSGDGIAGDGISFRPYIAANFDNGSSLKVGFVYAGGSTNPAVAQMGIPIVYTWAF